MTARLLLELLLCVVFIAHVLYAPYTKIEETWTLHATHDILRYGISPSSLRSYDHIVRTGPVPRSFVGPLLLSGLSKATSWLAYPLFQPLFGSALAKQVVAREVAHPVRVSLALCNALALVYLGRSLPQRVGCSFLLLTACQFHIPFWAGRTVPNMVAFPFVQVALVHILKRGQRQLWGYLILGMAASVIRNDLAPLFLCLLSYVNVYMLTWRRLLTCAFIFTSVLVGAIIIDTYFWQNIWSNSYLWPEMYSFLFNAVEGKSAEWGTSPAHYYFTRLLPRLTTFTRLSSPVMASIGCLSYLQHKEWRFIVYGLPLLNASALLFIFDRLPKRVAQFVFGGLIASTAAATIFSAFVSHHNYPGGYAMALLQATHPDKPTHIHIDIYSKMTGASLFTQEYESWIYNRTEDLASPDEYRGFDLLLTHDPVYHQLLFDRTQSIQGYTGIDRAAVKALRWQEATRLGDLIWVMASKGG